MQHEAQSAGSPPDKAARFRQIMAVLARHGLGAIARSDEAERGKHAREACEELGTTFIKLGQLLATRSDLLPEPVCDELRKLQDNVPPVPTSQVTEIIEEEFGAPPSRLFAWFDDLPVASASIGQAHAARLKDGREVIIKVRKAGVEELVRTDLEILNDHLRVWTDRFPALQDFDLGELVREFGDILLSELDYTKEADNIRTFTQIFENERGYRFPAVIAEYSSTRVITMTRLTGERADAATGLTKRRRSALARRLSRLIIEPAFSAGIFHADPHPGNILIAEDGALIVLDLGMVGRLTPEARRRVADIFLAIDRRDADRLADRLVEIASPVYPIDRAGLVSRIERILQKYVAVPFEAMRFDEALSELLQLIREYRMRLPGAYALLFKALAMTEALLETIDPDAGLSDYLEPLAGKMVYGPIQGEEWVERVRDSAMDAAQLSVELPRRVDRVLGQVERGNIRVWARLEDMEVVISRFQHIVERANATMLAAACIVALAVMMLFYHPQGWQRWIGVVFWIAVAAAFVHVVRTLLALRK